MGLMPNGSQHTQTNGPQLKKTRPDGKNLSKAYKKLPFEDDALEGRIPLGLFPIPGDEDISGEFLRGIVQVLRGMYAPGLHLMMNPRDSEFGTISVRMQEGRQYLDTDTDILFSRYGVADQEWTVVGTIGHHARRVTSLEPNDFVRDDGSIDRSKFAQFVTRLGGIMGTQGFTDIAQVPGFTIVPWAIYRNLADAKKS